MNSVHDQLDHPIIDVDSHSIEYLPVVYEYMADMGSATLVDRLRARESTARQQLAGPESRQRWRLPRGPWWTRPSQNTLDRATAMLPGLLAERLEEIGLDHSIVYPTVLNFPMDPDPDIRVVGCRALNQLRADLFAPYADRLTPVALIPMHTPDEAVECLDHAIGTLGMKAINFPSFVLRPLSILGHTPYDDTYVGALGNHSAWIDNLVIDSLYDYDPVWQHCVDLGVVPTFHSPGMFMGGRVSISNYVYNHLGGFAAGGEIICKALFVGGVTKRFPSLRFGLLEGGVGWACNLLCDIVGHWEKRNGIDVHHYDPATVDHDQLRELFSTYGHQRYVAALDLLESSIVAESRNGPLGDGADDPTVQQRHDPVDDFDAADISSIADIIERFVPSFFFGCEADDPLTQLAFDGRFTPNGSGLQPIFSSDIGHWDVPDVRDVLHEAYEAVERGTMAQTDFRRFAFDNPAKMYTDMRPDFFAGTTVEKAVTESVATADRRRP